MTDLPTSPSLVVSEVFGPTVQGEGPSVGRRCGFIRLGLCNLHCVWCDTPYTWDWDRYDRDTELRRVSIEELMEQVDAMGVNLVVVSGGEPVVQAKNLVRLAEMLRLSGVDVEVETNGTLHPQDLFRWVHFNVSPKLAHAGDPEDRRLTQHLAAYVRPDTAFKFVVQTADQLDEVAGIVNRYAIPAGQVWIMPEGRHPMVLEDTLAAVADETIARGWNLTGRMQVTIWGDKRGH